MSEYTENKTSDEWNEYFKDLAKEFENSGTWIDKKYKRELLFEKFPMCNCCTKSPNPKYHKESCPVSKQDK